MSLESIVPQHAVVLPKQPGDTSLMTYVRSVSSVIGSSNVLAVYDSGTAVKIYLKSAKHVGLLVNRGLVLHGLYSNAEYAVPRGDKVVLSNVDPIIPDDELVKLLGSYGTLESELMYRKPFTECEYAHIKSDVRYVYMNIYDRPNFPCKLDWMLNDMWYEIFVTVEERNKIGCARATDPRVPRVEELTRPLPTRTPGPNSTPGLPQPAPDGPHDPFRAENGPADVKPENLRKFKPKKILGKVKPKLKPGKLSGYSRSSGNPHPMSLKKFLRDAPPEALSRYPMDCRRLTLFFKQTYRNRLRSKLEVVLSLLGTSDPGTLRDFRAQLVDVSRHMGSVPITLRVNRVLAEIDAHLAGPRD